VVLRELSLGEKSIFILTGDQKSRQSMKVWITWLDRDNFYEK